MRQAPDAAYDDAETRIDTRNDLCVRDACRTFEPLKCRMRLTVGHRSGVSGSSSHDLHHSTPYSDLIRLSPQCSARAHHRGSGIVCGISLLSSIRLSFRIFTQLKINFGGLVRY
jgi:hypothetical protein